MVNLDFLFGKKPITAIDKAVWAGAAFANTLRQQGFSEDFVRGWGDYMTAMLLSEIKYE